MALGAQRTGRVRRPPEARQGAVCPPVCSLLPVPVSVGLGVPRVSCPSLFSGHVWSAVPCFPPPQILHASSLLLVTSGKKAVRPQGRPSWP